MTSRALSDVMATARHQPWSWRTVLTLLVTLLPCVTCGGGLVQHTQVVSVDVGRSAYLAREDLRIARTRRGEDCKVEVVTADPVTQRVGHLNPTVSIHNIALFNNYLCLNITRTIIHESYASQPHGQYQPHNLYYEPCVLNCIPYSGTITNSKGMCKL